MQKEQQVSESAAKRLEHSEIVFYLVSREFILKHAANTEEEVECARKKCTKRFVLKDGIFLTFWSYVEPPQFYANKQQVFSWGYRAFCCEECRLRGMPRRGLHWA